MFNLYIFINFFSSRNKTNNKNKINYIMNSKNLK